VKIPDSTGRTGIICSSRPAKKPLLASNSSPHHQRNVAEEFEDALKNENLDAISTHFIVMVANHLSQLYLVFIGRSQFGTIDTVLELRGIMVISPCPLMMKQHRSFEIYIWVEIISAEIVLDSH